MEAIIASMIAIHPMGMPWLYVSVNTKRIFSNTRRTHRIVPCFVVPREMKVMREYNFTRGGAEAGGETRRVFCGAYEGWADPP